MDTCKENFCLDRQAGYFKCCGVDVMAFDDIYPAGHQSGVSILMHGKRVATNGDVRFEQTPGQWQPLPRQESRSLCVETQSIDTHLRYPDTENHLKGFNPMIYPDFAFSYDVHVKAEGRSIRVSVDMDCSVPDEYLGKLCFMMELFPGDLIGKPWIMDGKQGIFPAQPNGPVKLQQSNYPHTATMMPGPGITANRERLSGDGKAYSPIIADDLIAEPYAAGRRFTVRPDEKLSMFTVESLHGDLKLYDGRMNHNNGWFTLVTELPAQCGKNAVEWVIMPHIDEAWMYEPVIQVSQVGYLPGQQKIARIELDQRDKGDYTVSLCRITENGRQEVLKQKGAVWGRFLRYRYLLFDFSSVREEGLYEIRCASAVSHVFRIAGDLYDRGVWQPVLEYFLPVQMCHMRVNEKYRVWHGLCHHDDARMAPVNYNHIDGYVQGPSTLTAYKSGEHVPGLNAGGWHDAGDYDLRIESQAGEMYILSLVYEAFHVNYDATTIDQVRQITEIHQPDGKNDLLQQIEHGALSVIGGYRALGRLYRGIICNDLRQYVLLGDGAAMTDGIIGNQDDRWVFTEDNPQRELRTAAQLAASSRALADLNPEMAQEALRIAVELYRITRTEDEASLIAKVHAAVELYLATGDEMYANFIKAEEAIIVKHISRLGWIVARVIHRIEDDTFCERIKTAMEALKAELESRSRETPYGIPYRPHIWGAGWDIQRLGFEHYFLHKAYPDLFGIDLICNALNFILGCHPGSNTVSFASGVGAKSATVAYGVNRADASYIPGGVISGTALIRPDFPELLTWPYLWQQTEYVLGGGSSHYMFLVLAVRELLREKEQ